MFGAAGNGGQEADNVDAWITATLEAPGLKIFCKATSWGRGRVARSRDDIMHQVPTLLCR